MRKLFTSFFALVFSVSSAYAGGTLTLMGVGPGTNAFGPRLIYNGTQTNAANANTLSATVDIGSAATGRLVVVTIGCRTFLNAAISSGTINGGAAIVRSTAGVGSNAIRSYAIILAAVVNSGTTASVSISANNQLQGCVFGSYSLYDLNSSTAFNSCGATDSCSVTTQSGGFAIAVGGSYESTCSMAPNQDFSVVLGGSFGTGCGGSAPTSGANSTWTTTFGSGISRSISVASWR